MRAKILGVCVVAALLLHLLARAGGRPARVPIAATPANDEDNAEFPRSWSSAEESASEQPAAADAEGYLPGEEDGDLSDDFAGPRQAPARYAASQARALFQRLDLNGDGVLSDEELPTRLRNELARWDADRDGAIGAEEFLAYFRTRVEQFQAGGDRIQAPSARAGAAPASLPAWFRALDADNDGQVSLYEWKAAGRLVAAFRKLDRNGDGLLTAREVLAAPAQAIPANRAPAPLMTQEGGGRGNASPAAPVLDPVAPQAGRSAGWAGASGLASIHRVSQPTPVPTPPAPASRLTPDQMEQRHLAAAASPSPAPAAAPARTAGARTSAAPAPAPALAALLTYPNSSLYPDSQATVASPIENAATPYWTTRDQQNEIELLLHGHANILFLGDSITDGFANGPGSATWERSFTPLDAEDFAIAGFTTSQVLWQVETGQVAAASPDVVVLMIGTNNLGLGQSPEATAAGITRIVDAIRGQLPQTQILLLGIFPRGQSPTDPFRARIAQVNQSIAGLEGEGVTYLDIGSWFLQTDGSIAPTVMADFVHPTAYGYQLYTAAIWDTLFGLLDR